VDEPFLQFSRSLSPSKEIWCKFVAGTVVKEAKLTQCKHVTILSEGLI
jgi:hypothetical protein